MIALISDLRGSSAAIGVVLQGIDVPGSNQIPCLGGAAGYHLEVDAGWLIGIPT